MAAWQFDFHVLPRDGVASIFGSTPLAITDDAFDTYRWWSNFQAHSEFEGNIAALLPRMTSWSFEVDRWGSEDGDRIDIVREGEKFSAVMVRVDTRRLSQYFLSGFVELAKKYNLVFRFGSGRVIRPSGGKLLGELRLSSAFRFSEDPKGFLESLEADGDLTSQKHRDER